MELKDQLEICRKCLKREDNSVGILTCGLTHERPDFDGLCVNFEKDGMEPEKYLDNGTTLGFFEIRNKLENEIYTKFRLDQKILPAIGFGILASVIGASIWAVISVFTGYQIGYMAVGVGALVGFSVRYFGNGFQIQYALFGAIVSLFGCLLGNLLSLIGFVSRTYEISFWGIFSHLDFQMINTAMTESFDIKDLLFYGLAVYEGFRFSAHRFTEKTLWQRTLKYRSN